MSLREKLESADQADREALHERFARACTANACQQGRTACPTPEACRLPADGSLVGFGLAACAVSAVAVLALLVMVFA